MGWKITLALHRSTQSTFLSSSKEARLSKDGVSDFLKMLDLKAVLFASAGFANKPSLPGLFSPIRHLGCVAWLLCYLWWQGLLQTGQLWLHPNCFLEHISCILYPPQASGDMSPQKAVALGKLKVRGNFLLLQKLQGIFWARSMECFNSDLFFLEYILYLWSLTLQLYQSESSSVFITPFLPNIDQWTSPENQLAKFVSYILV